MYYFRVTKYNPIYRDENGFYKKNEWISVGDIGQCYDGEILTAENYQNIENAYVNAILSAVYELKVKSFKITCLQKNDYREYGFVYEPQLKCLHKTISDKMIMSIIDIPDAAKLILRENLWAKLESNYLSIHFGYDYYIYFCAKKKLNQSLKIIEESGLFIRPVRKPEQAASNRVKASRF